MSIAVLMAVATPIQLGSIARADQYDDQINALQSQMEQYKAQAGVLQAKIGSLQDTINGLQVQKNVIQTQINLNQAKLDKLNQQIKDTEQKIQDNKDALGATIANMYVDDSISPLEMLASSKNIGDYVDKQSYRSSVSDQLQQTIKTINNLKISLSKDKASVESLLLDQNNQKNALIANEQQEQALLNETQGQEANYQALIASTKSKMDQAAAAQRAAIARMGSSGSFGGYVSADVTGVTPQSAFDYRNWSGNMGCGSDGYPYCGSQDSYADAWSLYNRECVSYATWRAAALGKKIATTAQGGGFHGHGMAYEYASSAKGWLGATVDNTPEVGAVAILPPVPGFAEVGHAMVVESVSGSWARVSQYNFGGTGEYSTMDILTTGVIYVHFK